MSDEYGEQRAVDGDETGGCDDEAKVVEENIRIVVEVSNKLELRFDVNGCEIETYDHYCTRLTHAEFDRLVSLPICAIRSALRTDVGRGSGANGLGQWQGSGRDLGLIGTGYLDRTHENGGYGPMARHRQEQETARQFVRNSMAQAEAVVGDVGRDGKESA